jgi:hypothetical protein
MAEAVDNTTRQLIFCHHQQESIDEVETPVQGTFQTTTAANNQCHPHSKGLGSDTLSRPVCNPYYKHP